MPYVRKDTYFVGYVPIMRSTPDGMKETRIPFSISDAGGSLIFSHELHAQAQQTAQQFLQLLSDTAPGRRDDYGQPGRAVFQYVQTTTGGAPFNPAAGTTNQRKLDEINLWEER